MQFLETIKAENGRPFHLEYHQRRMDRTCEAFGIPRAFNLKTLLNPPPEGLVRCRIVYDTDTIAVTYHTYVPRAFKSLQAVIDDTIAYDFKYLDRRQLDQLYEQRAASDEIAIVKNGLLTDATIANLAFFDGTRWFTPRQPLLRGTTRARMLDVGKLFEADISVEALETFERCALLNAMLGFVEVENGIILPKE